MDKVEQATGVTYEPNGLLADMELRSQVPPSSNVRDPIHVVLSGVVLNADLRFAEGLGKLHFRFQV